MKDTVRGFQAEILDIKNSMVLSAFQTSDLERDRRTAKQTVLCVGRLVSFLKHEAIRI